MLCSVHNSTLGKPARFPHNPEMSPMLKPVTMSAHAKIPATLSPIGRDAGGI